MNPLEETNDMLRRGRKKISLNERNTEKTTKIVLKLIEQQGKTRLK
jgi:hypothetical protein